MGLPDSLNVVIHDFAQDVNVEQGKGVNSTIIEIVSIFCSSNVA